MEIQKSHIYVNPYLVDEDIRFEEEDFKGQYPILSMDSCHLKASFFKRRDQIHAKLDIDAVAVLEDSYTCKPFRKKIAISEETRIMEDEDYESEGFIIPGKTIDVNFLVLSIIRSSLPILVLDEGSKLPEGVEGFRVVREKDAGSDSGEGSPFDVLKDLDLD